MAVLESLPLTGSCDQRRARIERSWAEVPKQQRISQWLYQRLIGCNYLIQAVAVNSRRSNGYHSDILNSLVLG